MPSRVVFEIEIIVVNVGVERCAISALFIDDENIYDHIPDVSGM